MITHTYSLWYQPRIISIDAALHLVVLGRYGVSIGIGDAILLWYDLGIDRYVILYVFDLPGRQLTQKGSELRLDLLRR